MRANEMGLWVEYNLNEGYWRGTVYFLVGVEMETDGG